MDDHCDECGFDGRTMGIADVRASLQAMPADVGGLVRAVPRSVLGTRPEPATWSAMEYLGHLRDLMAFHRHAIEQALAHHEPDLELVDPDAHVADAGYADADPDDILAQFGRRVARLDALLATLSEPDLDRRAGFGTGVIDIRLIMRSAVHEGVHHQGDLSRLVGRAR